METKPSAPYDLPPPYPGLPGSGPSPQVVQPPSGFQPPPAGFQQPSVNQAWMSGYQGGHQQGYPQSGPPPVSTQGSGIPPQYNVYSAPLQTGGVHTSQPGVTMVAVIPAQTFGPYSVQVVCPKCGVQVMTSTRSQSGLITYLTCGLCILFGCWFGCCLVPFCINELQDMEHFCPNCNAFLGAYRRL